MSLLGEIFTQLIGEAAIEALRDPKKERQPFPEGETNASLGAASTFFATIGFLFALPVAMIATFVGPTPDMGSGGILVLACWG